MKLIVLIFCVVISSLAVASQDRSIDVSAFNIRLHNLADLDMDQVRMELRAECWSRRNGEVKLCGASTPLTVRRLADSYVVDGFRYSYQRGFADHVAIAVKLTHPDVTVIGVWGRQTFRFPLAQGPRQLRDLTLFRPRPFAVQTTVRGVPLSQWLRQNNVHQLLLSIWLKPLLANGGPPPTLGWVSHYQGTYLRDDVTTLSSQSVIAFPGPPANRRMRVNIDVRTSLLGRRMLDWRSEMALSQDAHTSMTTLDLR